MNEQQQTRKAMRQLKRDRKALQYAKISRNGGGARECARRELGGFFNLPQNRQKPLVSDALPGAAEPNA